MSTLVCLTPSPSPCCASVSPSTGGKLKGLMTNFRRLTVNARSSLSPLLPPPPPPFSWNIGRRWIFSIPCGRSSCAVAAPEVTSASMRCGKGVNSNTPSLSISIHRTRPNERGYNSSGRVIRAVSWVGYCRSRLRKEWRN